MKKIKYLSTALLLLMLASCGSSTSNDSITSVDTTLDETTSETTTTSTTTKEETTVEEEEKFVTVTFKDVIKEGNNTGYGDKGNGALLIKYFNDQKPTFVSNFTLSNLYADELSEESLTLRCGVKKSEGFLNLSLGYDIKRVEVKAQDYYSYYSYGKGVNFVEGWNNDQAKLKVNTVSQELKHYSSKASEEETLIYTFDEPTKEVSFSNESVEEGTPSRLFINEIKFVY